MKRDFELVWKEIEEYFNFENVYNVMKALDWHWYINTDNNGIDVTAIPSVDYLKIKAKRICKDCYSDGNLHSNGGFTALIDNDELYLSFNVDETSALINE